MTDWKNGLHKNGHYNSYFSFSIGKYVDFGGTKELKDVTRVFNLNIN